MATSRPKSRQRVTVEPSKVKLVRRAVFDAVLPDELFKELATEATSLDDGESGYPGFLETDYWRFIKPFIFETLGQVDLVASFFVQTLPGAAGSHPHLDHGNHSAVLHLNQKWDLAWGGDFFFVKDDKKTIDQAVEFRPNRLVVWDRNQLHMHRPPTGCCSEKARHVLVMRFSDAIQLE